MNSLITFFLHCLHLPHNDSRTHSLTAFTMAEIPLTPKPGSQSAPTCLLQQPLQSPFYPEATQPVHPDTQPEDMDLPGSSTSWNSPSAVKAHEYARMAATASHLGFANSPFFPKSAKELEAHKIAFEGDTRDKERENLLVKVRDAEERKRLAGLDGARVESARVKVDECMPDLKGKGKGVEGKGEKGSTVAAPKANTTTESNATDIKPLDASTPGLSKVLGLPTCAWAGSEPSMLEGQRDIWGDRKSRAFWPETSELRAYGEARHKAGKSRQLPPPRMDFLSDAKLLALMTNGGKDKLESLTEEEIKERLLEVEGMYGEGMKWWDREVCLLFPFPYLMLHLSLDMRYLGLTIIACPICP